MPPENGRTSEQPDSSATPDEDAPIIQDGYEVDEPPAADIVEDDPEFLAPTSRALEVDTDDPQDGEDDSAGPSPTAAARASADDTTDAGSVMEESDSAEPATAPAKEPDWANELSAQRIAVELKRIETEIRRLLEDRDTKRKRKLGGTRRWLDLEEDLIAWRHSGRFEEATLIRLSELITQRHYLFKRLKFVTRTRPVWNT
jgi:hypothetical protein